MPLYEYVCDHCGAEIEVLQKISEDPLRDCPACHQPALRKRVSAAGFRLAGSGWYETDFKKDKKRNLKEDSSASGAAASSGGAPAESKAKPENAAASSAASSSTGQAT